ncbi:MAG: AzlC family ABC transporter permease [Desertimonas sp.]
MADDDGVRTAERSVLLASVTLGVAVGVFGIAFGVGVISAGGTVVQACAMSVLVFTGASQFSAVSVIAAGGTTGAALGGALVLAARNAVYGLSMSRVLVGSFGTRLAAAQLVIDESTAMAMAQPTLAGRRRAFWTTGVAVFVCWNVGTLLGAVLGTAVDPQAWGLDAAFPAGFVAMVAPHLRTRRGLLAGLLGAAICLVLVPITPIGVPILAASAAIILGLPGRSPGWDGVAGGGRGGHTMGGTS